MGADLEQYLAVQGSAVHLVERSHSPSTLLAQMERAAPWLDVIRAPPSELGPRISLQGSANRGEITFIGTLEGRVAEALAVLLRSVATGEVEFDTPATPQLLGALRVNVGIGVHVSATCAFCPSVMAAALRFAQATGWIDVVVARADEDPSTCYRSVPTVVVDGEIVSIGSIGEYALAERVMERVGAP